MKAYIFPGQGAQFPGMGKELYGSNAQAKALFDEADAILGYKITGIMFGGTDEDLRQTKITQPAVFLHSVISALCSPEGFRPDMVGGHSLGEFSALTAAGTLSFADGLRLVYARAMAMQAACEKAQSAMAAVIGLSDQQVEDICKEVSAAGGGIVVPANYNCPGQLVISGDAAAVKAACEKLKAAGAKRALPLKVGGAFHSPLMESAREELAAAIDSTVFAAPVCPVYQNVDGKAYTNPDDIKKNLIAQLVSPVRWTEEVSNMAAAGATEFIECGPGKVLQGLVIRICKGSEPVTARSIG